VLICIPCLEVRLAQPDLLPGFHDPGQPWEQWGCPINGCGRWFLGPWYLEWHTAAEHPGWTATHKRRGRIRTSASGSCSGGSRTRPADWSASTGPGPARRARLSKAKPFGRLRRP
jgi:hypothetical protein